MTVISYLSRLLYVKHNLKESSILPFFIKFSRMTFLSLVYGQLCDFRRDVYDSCIYCRDLWSNTRLDRVKCSNCFSIRFAQINFSSWWPGSCYGMVEKSSAGPELLLTWHFSWPLGVHRCTMKTQENVATAWTTHVIKVIIGDEFIKLK